MKHFGRKRWREGANWLVTKDGSILVVEGPGTNRDNQAVNRPSIDSEGKPTDERKVVTRRWLKKNATYTKNLG